MAYILILGARSDIARAVSHTFARNGFNLYLAARRHEELDPDQRDLTIRYGVMVETREFDVLATTGHGAFYNGLGEKPIGVVCAVGYLGDQEKAERDPAEARRILDTNFTGCVSILSIVANDFEKRSEGFIIGISSAAGDRGKKSNYYYGSAKAGLTAFLSGLRNRLHPSGVRVITVKPGFVSTKMTEGMDLPRALTATPEEAADDIFRAWLKDRDVIYTKWYWKFIMLIIRHIPEKIFRKLSL
jgi:short-subunit dehydrogenase